MAVRGRGIRLTNAHSAAAVIGRVSSLAAMPGSITLSITNSLAPMTMVSEQAAGRQRLSMLVNSEPSTEAWRYRPLAIRRRPGNDGPSGNG